MRIIFMILVVIFLWTDGSSANLNTYSDSKYYKTVCVRPGDTVWQIAARYTNDKEDIRELVMAIVKLNKLDNNARVYPGQTIKVPQKQSIESIAIK